MSEIKAFIGHSFEDDDKEVVRVFLDYFNTFRKIGFDWECAKDSEPKAVSEKVKEKMEGKDLFIGIFTRKNRQIEKANLEEKKKQYCGDKNKFSWNTSYWIIQESGYALGKGMQLLFLVEEGIPLLNGLQGDLEFIPFSRENPQMSFQKINEMINSLLQKPVIFKKQEAVAEQKDVEQNKKEEEFESVEIKKDRNDWSDNDYRRALFEAISIDNGEEEERICEEYLKNKEGDEKAKIEWESEKLYFKYFLNKSNVLEKLKNLSEQNPKHSKPHLCLGKIYEDYENFIEASREYIRAAECSKDEIGETTSMCYAAKVRAKNKGYQEARKLILDLISQRENIQDDEYYEVFKTLGFIALEERDIESFTSFYEKVLTLKPDKHELRFNLAYKYSEENKDAFSLYHYNLLCEQRRNNGTDWNNLGVAYNQLEMKSNAVRAYNEAKKLKTTIAIANLGEKLIREGFLS